MTLLSTPAQPICRQTYVHLLWCYGHLSCGKYLISCHRTCWILLHVIIRPLANIWFVKSSLRKRVQFNKYRFNLGALFVICFRVNDVTGSIDVLRIYATLWLRFSFVSVFGKIIKLKDKRGIKKLSTIHFQMPVRHL